MATIPNYVTIPAGSQILGAPLNLSFTQAYNVLNGNLDFNNIGTAKLNASLIVSGPTTKTGSWAFSGNLAVNGGNFTTTSSAGLLTTGSFPAAGTIILGRASGVAVAYMGGTTSQASISYNLNGINDFAFSTGALCGYQGATALGNLAPMFTLTGAAAPAKVVIGATQIAAYSSPGTAVNLSNDARFFSQTSYTVFASAVWDNFTSVSGSPCLAFSSTISGAQFGLLAQGSSAQANAQGYILAPVRWIAIGQ